MCNGLSLSDGAAYKVFAGHAGATARYRDTCETWVLERRLSEKSRNIVIAKHISRLSGCPLIDREVHLD